jgi:hypothetical protein
MVTPLRSTLLCLPLLLGLACSSDPDESSPADPFGLPPGIGSGGTGTGSDAPSCFDGVSNGDETGIDCGGSCEASCEDQVITALWSPFAEWSYENPTFDDSPFDLEATATFTDGTTAHLFYAGDHTWRLLFMCSEVGTYLFSTTSADAELDGLSGSVVCQENPGARGSLVAGGRDEKKFVDLGTGRAVVPNWIMAPTLFEWEAFSDEWKATWIANNLDAAGWQGVHSPGIANRWYDWDCDGTATGCEGDEPDLRAFEAYERFLAYFHERGLYVHIWLWWDQERDLHDKHYADPAPRTRLRRYIADRLGAYPNLLVGHGFDNHEYVDDDPDYPDTWARDFLDRFAFPHFVEIRGEGSTAHVDLCPSCNMKSWDTAADPIDFTYALLRQSYDDAGPMPVMETDRYRYRQNDGAYREKDVASVDEQRHWMWWLTMVGGVGAIWGNLEHQDTTHKPVEGIYSSVEGYPSEEWNQVIRGWHDFWYATQADPTHRFRADMERCSDLTDGHGLCRRGSHYVFFATDTDRIAFDLSALSGTATVVAFDTKTGSFYPQPDATPATTRFDAPHASDWAVAVGSFADDVSLSTFGDTVCDDGFETPSECPADCQAQVLIDDPLLGSTVGTQVGGSLTAEGFRPGLSNDGESHILYEVNGPVSAGYAEVEVKGFDMSAFPTPTASQVGYDSTFITLYDGRGIAEPVDYIPELKHNFFRWTVHYRSPKYQSSAGDKFKSVVNCSAPTPERLNASRAVFEEANGDGVYDYLDRDWTAEPNGIHWDWDPSRWYTIRAVWGAKQIRVFCDGVEVWFNELEDGQPYAEGDFPIVAPYDYAPIDLRIWVGSGPGRYSNKMPNIVYRHFKLVAGGS